MFLQKRLAKAEGSDYNIKAVIYKVFFTGRQ
jgi:hypothetical protein